MGFEFGTPIYHGEQSIFVGRDALLHIKSFIRAKKAERPFLVCGNSARSFNGWDEMVNDIEGLTVFSGFSPNPDYESVVEGVRLFKKSNSDLIISIGGGSAIDVAKTIKLFSAMESERDYLTTPHIKSELCHLAIPTTAGTGSESTSFAVIYYKGEKQSVEDECMRPDIVLLDAGLLSTLPRYQRECALFDAVCQCIESIWAKGATDESIAYAEKGLKMILQVFDRYLLGDEEAAQDVLLAANMSGRAINISKTTAAHAMSYGISTTCQISHGHAVAICLPVIWKYLIGHVADSEDGKRLKETLHTISECFSASSFEGARQCYLELLHRTHLGIPTLAYTEVCSLVRTVNIQRLSNTPVPMKEQDLVKIYSEVFGIT